MKFIMDIVIVGMCITLGWTCNGWRLQGQIYKLQQQHTLELSEASREAYGYADEMDKLAAGREQALAGTIRAEQAQTEILRNELSKAALTHKAIPLAVVESTIPLDTPHCDAPPAVDWRVFQRIYNEAGRVGEGNSAAAISRDGSLRWLADDSRGSPSGVGF